jgi:hypothetical protein
LREKAINWAVQEWNVDIITMSLALQEGNPDIEVALNEALDPSYVGAMMKIVFAAAGNNSDVRKAWRLLLCPALDILERQDSWLTVEEQGFSYQRPRQRRSGPQVYHYQLLKWVGNYEYTLERGPCCPTTGCFVAHATGQYPFPR